VSLRGEEKHDQDKHALQDSFSSCRLAIRRFRDNRALPGGHLNLILDGAR
jgi:hypothetical protein